MTIETKFSIGDKVKFPYFPYQSNTLTAVGYISGIMINVGKDEINTRYMVAFPYTCSGVERECITSAFEHELKQCSEDEYQDKVQTK